MANVKNARNTTQKKANYPSSAKDQNFIVWVSEKEVSLEFEDVTANVAVLNTKS